MRPTHFMICAPHLIFLNSLSNELLYQTAHIAPANFRPSSEDARGYIKKVLDVCRGTHQTFGAAVDASGFFWHGPDFGGNAEALAKINTVDVAAVALLLGRLRGACASAFIPATLVAVLERAASDLQVPVKVVQKAVRLALTGGTSGPGIAQLMVVLGRERALARLGRFLAQPAALSCADKPLYPAPGA
jgi:glutamyl/glutaminyl-tRNA synthetase